jgi:hypothetical protein
MATSIELVLLKCGQCSTPLPAEEDEVAWVCPTCGKGWLLVETGLVPQAVDWAVPRAGARPDSWRPFWVWSGQARFLRRDAFRGRGDPDPLWARNPCRFYLPAYNCELAQLEDIGADLVRRQVELRAGPPAGPLQGCTLLPDEARRALEFVVLTIEAERKDKLRHVEFGLDLGAPELWVLPMEGGRVSV